MHRACGDASGGEHARANGAAGTRMRHTSLSSSGRTIGGRIAGWSLQMVRMEPPCTLCHSFFFLGAFSPGYSRRFSTNASFVLIGIIGSITCV